MTHIARSPRTSTAHPSDVVVLHRFSGTALFSRQLVDLARERGLRVVPLLGPRRAPGSWLGRGVGSLDDLTALPPRAHRWSRPVAGIPSIPGRVGTADG